MSTATLPRQVQEQLDEAERFQAQIAAQATPADSGNTADSVTDPTNPGTASVATADVAHLPAQDDWQRRYETLQGKFNAEVPRLHEQVRERDGMIQSLHQRLQALEAGAATQRQEKAQQLVTPKDEETFGSDLLDAMRRVTREETQAMTTRLAAAEKVIQQSLQAVQRFTKVEQDVATSRQERFWQEIERAVPDWQAINTSKEWLAWLSEYDPMAGAPRQDALNAAQQTLDFQRVIAMFKMFSGKLNPTPVQTQAQTELARQVQPARSATTQSGPKEKQAFTGAEYAYWTDPRRMHDTLKDKADAMRAEVERAYTEGRVKW